MSDSRLSAQRLVKAAGLDPVVTVDPVNGQRRSIRAWRCGLCPDAVWRRGDLVDAYAHYLDEHGGVGIGPAMLDKGRPATPPTGETAGAGFNSV